MLYCVTDSKKVERLLISEVVLVELEIYSIRPCDEKNRAVREKQKLYLRMEEYHKKMKKE